MVPKQTSGKLILLFISLVIFCSGIFAGKWYFRKRVLPAVTANTTHASDSGLLNPLIGCMEEKGMNRYELKMFKPSLEKYIAGVKLRHPDIFIAYYFRDMNNGLWIGINEKEEFSPASLMKVPLMLAVLKHAELNPGTLGNKLLFVKAQYSNIDEESGFDKKDSSWFTIEELLEQSIRYSDNKASLMLMNYIGMDKVINMEDALNLHVKPEYGVYTNFVTVKAYAGIFRILYNASYLNKAMSEKALRLLSDASYSKGIRAGIPAKYMIAHKYGERDIFLENGKRKILQLHHFGLVYYPGKPFLLGIMTRGADREVKEKIIADLASITFSEFEKQVQNTSQDYIFKE